MHVRVLLEARAMHVQIFKKRVCLPKYITLQKLCAWKLLQCTAIAISVLCLPSARWHVFYMRRAAYLFGSVAAASRRVNMAGCKV